jgi:ribokinase
VPERDGASCDVLVIGSANLDLVAGADRIPDPGETVLGTTYAEHPGGKGLNQAVAAARAGASVAMVGAVGDDDAGRTLLEVLRAEGVDAANVAVVAGVPTGRALITVAADGENSIVVVPGANATVRAPGAVRPARVALAQLEVPLETVTATLRAARDAGATTVLNPAPARQLPPELVAACDVLVPNEHEVAMLGGVDALLAAGVAAVVVTLGARGIDVVTADGTYHQPAFAVQPVDTTGAGDATCGALGARLATGDPIRDAVAFAAAAGALTTTAAGAVPSLPRREAIERLLGG